MSSDSACGSIATTHSEVPWTIEDDRRKKHEAIWKQTCSRTHSLWCPCGDWTSHIKPRCVTGDAGGVDGGVKAANDGGDPGAGTAESG
nr:MAG: ORF2 [Torque teno felis virus]